MGCCVRAGSGMVRVRVRAREASRDFGGPRDADRDVALDRDWEREGVG